MEENYADEQANTFTQIMTKANTRTHQYTMNAKYQNTQRAGLSFINKEDRIIERELRNNMDQTEDNIRPRTPPNIKLDENQHPDLLEDDSEERFAEECLKIQKKEPIRKMSGYNNKRRESSKTIQSRDQQAYDETDVKYYLQEMVQLMSTKDKE